MNIFFQKHNSEGLILIRKFSKILAKKYHSKNSKTPFGLLLKRPCYAGQTNDWVFYFGQTKTEYLATFRSYTKLDKHHIL